MRGRAFRRCTADRSKRQAQSILVAWGKPTTPRNLGLVGSTRRPCSCWMCGNPRRYYGEPTRQEVLATERTAEEL